MERPSYVREAPPQLLSIDHDSVLSKNVLSAQSFFLYRVESVCNAITVAAEKRPTSIDTINVRKNTKCTFLWRKVRL